MNALQDEIRHVVEAVVEPLVIEMNNLKRLVERLEKDGHPEFVTVKEAARILRCCEKTIHHYCDAGRLEVRRDGRKKLISYASLIETRS